MATKEERTGLLSKVALFVRNPTKDWSELDQPASQDEAGYDKQALQAMIERKRQNDFVRRREFDHLRRLRNRDPAAAAGGARASNFMNSVPTDLDGRATTLKKIDEIEAQMSKQWWKNKGDGSSAPGAALPTNEATVSAAVEGSTRAPVTTSQAFAPTDPSGVTISNEFISTHMSDIPGLSSQQVQDALRQQAAGQPAAAAAPSDFLNMHLNAMEVEEIATDPELEEAAIRFANGDVAGAEKSLQDALAGQDVAATSAQSWTAALLDLYRATNRRADFERAAAAYFAHLDGVHPVWSNLGQDEDFTAPTVPMEHMGIPVDAVDALWSSPPELSMVSLQHLQMLMGVNAMPWRINWRPVREIAPDALPMLHSLFTSLCEEAVSVAFAGSEQLLQALRLRTPVDQRAVDSGWWHLRLAVLRAMRLHEEFENAALDYCVTYEIMAPGWVEPRCQVDLIDPAPPPAQDAGPPTKPMQYQEYDGLSALHGEILGDATDALSGLLDLQGPGQPVTIGCSKLLRVDFAAAGSILNWVAMRQAEGRQIHFHNVHRLVAAFFNVIGINEYAKVMPRPV